MIKLLLEIKSSFFSRKIWFSLWTLKVDINLLKQDCKPADWIAELIDWGTLALKALKALKALWYQNTWDTQGTRALEALEGRLGT